MSLEQFHLCLRHRKKAAEVSRKGTTALDVDYVVHDDGVNACRRHSDSGLPQVSSCHVHVSKDHSVLDVSALHGRGGVVITVLVRALS